MKYVKHIFSPFNFSLFSPPFFFFSFSVSHLFLPHIYQPKLNASSITHLCSFSLSNGKTKLRFNFESSLRYRLPVAATITNVLLCNPRRCALEHCLLNPGLHLRCWPRDNSIHVNSLPLALQLPGLFTLPGKLIPSAY